MTEPHPLVEAQSLIKEFRFGGFLGTGSRVIRAVDDVTLSIARGEAVGLVGESGSGKTTLGRLILRLLEPSEGTVRFDGHDLLALDRRSLRTLRRRMQVVFQDSAGSLNPRMMVGAAVREPMVVHRLYRGRAADARVVELFGEVGLDASHVGQYPHELSGGQRQRVGIARALSVEPDFLVLDEPVSALDVSVQAQVLNLLADLRERRHLTYLFIAHDLAVVRHLAERVAVMYAGRLAESAPTATLFTRPLHPYTTSLLSAIPTPDPARQATRIVLADETKRATERPRGCAFHERCPHPRKDERCRAEAPALRNVEPERHVACHYSDEPIPVPSVAARPTGHAPDDPA
jgi:oligopeptide/dipeptide ABC transporter ATP-binding protein